MPAYLKYNETEDHFSNLFTAYVSESVDPDYHRSLLSFRNYDALKRQLANLQIDLLITGGISAELEKELFLQLQHRQTTVSSLREPCSTNTKTVVPRLKA